MFVGRAPETRVIGELLARARAGEGGAVLVRGEAGVGKSALLVRAAEQARAFTVLRCAGVEVESELPYAGLHQLLLPVLGRLDVLPSPQAVALRGAFALTGETVDERFHVSLGVLGLLSESTSNGPLLCLVDDAQWLDQPSAEALLFAARRLEAESIAMVFAAREPFAARGVADIRLQSLTPNDSRVLLRERLGTGVADSVIEWLVTSAAGNPLALVELPRSLSERQLAGRDSLSGVVPGMTTIQRLYLDRAAVLSPEGRNLLLLAAAEDTGARATIERAANELGLDGAVLAEAEAAELIRVDAGQVVFLHPLVRAAVYRNAPYTHRERAHRVLAIASDAEGSADRAAWHRAAATVGTSEDTARDLEATAGRARMRSGHGAAASALDRAAELTPDPGAKGRRLVAAAHAAWNAGQPERARALLARAAPMLADPALSAEANGLRGLIEWRCGVLGDAHAMMLAGAREIAPTDPATAARLLSDCALACWDAGAYEALAEVGRVAGTLTADDRRESLLVDVLTGSVALICGSAPSSQAHVRAAISAAADEDDPRLLIWAAIGAEVAGEHEVETAALSKLVGIARASGAVDRLTLALESTVVQKFLSGQHNVVGEAAEGLGLAREAGLPNAASLHLASLTWLAGVQGRTDECLGGAAEVRETAQAHGHALAWSIAEWGVALLDLSDGRPGDAADRLGALGTAAPGLQHPFYVLSSAPDLVEAAVRAGRPDEARAALAIVENAAAPGGPEWLAGLTARSRALMAEGDDAEREYREALRIQEHGNAFDRARTELALGEHLRRQRRRSEAREPLRSALEGFERLGAKPWAERARGELRATGETARVRDPSAVDELTPQELQIARLVAGGHSNKEVAARLFLSPRTVEYHLRKVFAKLGIGSRAELVRDGVGGDAA